MYIFWSETSISSQKMDNSFLTNCTTGAVSYYYLKLVVRPEPFKNTRSQLSDYRRPRDRQQPPQQQLSTTKKQLGWPQDETSETKPTTTSTKPPRTERDEKTRHQWTNENAAIRKFDLHTLTHNNQQPPDRTACSVIQPSFMLQKTPLENLADRR